MSERYYNVQVIYKAGLEERVLASDAEDAQKQAVELAEMSGDHLETIAVHVDGGEEVEGE